jgi:ATP-dependent protease ClpP protease subunit
MSKNKLKISAEAQDNKAVIRISGYISEWNNQAESFRAALQAMIDSGLSEMVVYINSEGGDCFQANEICNVLSTFKGKKTAKLGALCASAATRIACSCDYVIAAKNNNYMIHKPWGYVSGNSSEIEAQIKLLKNLEAEYAKAYAYKTKLSVAKIESMWVEDYWMSAEEAKTLGFVDEIEGDTEITPEDVAAINASGYKRVPTIKATIKDNQNNQNNMKEKLIIILASVPGITVNASMSDDAIIAIVDGLKAKAVKADQLLQENERIKKEANEAKINAQLDAYEKDKRITPAERDYYKASFERDFDGTKKHLDAKQPVSQLSRETGGGSVAGEDRSKWTYADFQDKDPKALAEMAEKDEARFKALFKSHYGKECE